MEEDRMIITKVHLQGYLKQLKIEKREFPCCVSQEFLIEIVKMAIDSFEG